MYSLTHWGYVVYRTLCCPRNGLKKKCNIARASARQVCLGRRLRRWVMALWFWGVHSRAAFTAVVPVIQTFGMDTLAVELHLHSDNDHVQKETETW